MPQTLGAHNERLAHARALRTAKGRAQQQRFLVEGPTLLHEAFESGFPVEAIFTTHEALERYEIVRSMEAAGVPAFAVDARVAAQLSEVETPTGVVAIALRRLLALDALMREPGLVLVLADIADPGNAGTLVRAAEAFGAARIVFGREGVDPYNPKVVRAAMGSLFRASVAVAQAGELDAALRAAGRAAIGLEPGAQPISEISFTRETALVVGQERRGLGPWREGCAQVASIPMAGPVQSLNAAVAGSIGLYEAAKGAGTVRLSSLVKRV